MNLFFLFNLIFIGRFFMLQCFFSSFAVCRNKISDFFHTISHRWTLNKYNIIRKNHAIRNFDREICRFYRAWCTLSSGMPSTGTFICLCFDCVHINLVHSHALVYRKLHMRWNLYFDVVQIYFRSYFMWTPLFFIVKRLSIAQFSFPQVIFAPEVAPQ